MALCSLCQNIPFSSLPAPPEPDGCSYTADNKDLIQLWYRGSKALPKDDIGYLWHEHLDALAKSTSTGCPLCSLVHAGVQTWVDRYRHEAENNKSFKEFHGQMELIPEGQQLWVTARFGGAAGFIVLVRNPSGRSSLYLLTGVGFSVDSGSPLANAFPLRLPESDSGSGNSLNVVSSWVKDCIDNHEKCRQEGDTSLPSRVLDVGSSGDVIRLVDTEGHSGRYASLSYCWGTSPGFVTSRESMDARQSGIRLPDLPKTFADAVTVTRHLGLRFLWIDILCICQDDADDWARESARMIDVYSNAHVVIATDHANDKSVGCFQRRDLAQSATINIPMAAAEESNPVQAALLFANNEGPFFRGEFELEPLTQRGWALQERVLSRRSLHYGGDQMYFECNHGITGENGCYSATRYCGIHEPPESLLTRRDLLGPDHVMWNRLLWAYGRRKLSQPTDKLPAVSGLASLFKDRLGADYVAGLWSDALMEGLAWQGLGNRKPMDNEMYIGPSWSWASYDGIAATGLSQGWTDTAEILEWHVDLKNENNPYGEVKDAWIRLRAPMAKLVPSEKTVTDHEVRLNKAGITPLPRLCTKHSDDEEGSVVSLDYKVARDSGEWREWALNVMLLGWYQRPEDGTDNEGGGCSEDPSYGLVVTLVSEEDGKKRMKRVGWMFLTGEEARKVREDEGSRTTVTLV